LTKTAVGYFIRISHRRPTEINRKGMKCENALYAMNLLKKETVSLHSLGNSGDQKD
jgi:hypothetical protein